MKKRAIKIVSIILSIMMIVGCMTGCGSKKESGSDDGGFRVAIVCSGAGQNDTGYNASACKKITEISSICKKFHEM